MFDLTLSAEFVTWLQGRSDLARVYRAMETVSQACSSRSLLAYRDGRDAAHWVCLLARDHGFADVADRYYRAYEWLCLRLLSL